MLRSIMSLMRSKGLQADYKDVTGQLTSTKKELVETKASYDAQIQSLNQVLAVFESKTIQDQKIERAYFGGTEDNRKKIGR